MSEASRRKGLTGEREARDLFAAAGFELRGLEGLGDWLAFKRVWRITDKERYGEPFDLTYHLEVKRYHERARWPEWWGQAKGDAPPGVPPLLCAREDSGEWLSLLRTADLLDVIA